MRPMFGRACDSPGDVRALQVTWGVRADLQNFFLLPGRGASVHATNQGWPCVRLVRAGDVRALTWRACGSPALYIQRLRAQNSREFFCAERFQSPRLSLWLPILRGRVEVSEQ